jgi:NitT/TauT family transport system substrate-binding protein
MRGMDAKPIFQRQIARQPLARQLLSRRTVLRGTGMGFAGLAAGAFLGCGSDDADGLGDIDGPPEVTRIVLPRHYTLCGAPLYVAESFLREEGFTEVVYEIQPTLSRINERLAEGALDIVQNYAIGHILSIAEGAPVTVLGGSHPGCMELFVRDGIETVGDLDGKVIIVSEGNPQAADYGFLENMLQFVGITPDVSLRMLVDVQPNRFIGGTGDAYLAHPPNGETLRALEVGKILVDTTTDAPWSQYFCCLFAANSGFVERNPIATRRALRALYRAVDRCAAEPDAVGEYLAGRGFALNIEHAKKIMGHIPWAAWRDYDPEETLRFYALRLKETGVIDQAPGDVIKRGVDWRFLESLREEFAFRPEHGRSAYRLACADEGAPS